MFVDIWATFCQPRRFHTDSAEMFVLVLFEKRLIVLLNLIWIYFFFSRWSARAGWPFCLSSAISVVRFHSIMCWWNAELHILPSPKIVADRVDCAAYLPVICSYIIKSSISAPREVRQHNKPTRPLKTTCVANKAYVTRAAKGCRHIGCR